MANITKLDFSIIGAEKSATTFLQRCLSEHPNIHIPKKEVTLFENPDYKKTILEDLKKAINKKNHHGIYGIKRPAYLAKKELPKRIYKHFPKSKIIVILRNPIKRAISAYFHQMRFGFIPIKNINKGLKNIINNNYLQNYPRSKEIIEFGLYSKHLTNYLKYFNKNKILVLFFKDIKNIPLKEIKKAYTFLKVNNNFIPTKTINTKPQAGIYSLLRIWLNTKINSFKYTYNSQKTRLEVKNQNLTEIFICNLVEKIDIIILSKLLKKPKPKINKKTKKTLANIYKKDISKLETILNKQLKFWN